MARARITYREFYDIPRAFVTRWANRLFFFDGHFDQSLDDYPDEYSVYELPMTLKNRLRSMPWEGLANLGRYIGRVPIERVTFDKTRRKAIDDDIFRDPLKVG